MKALTTEEEITALQQAIHVIHRANSVYWRTQNPSHEVRAEYYWRQERLGAIRIALVTARRDLDHKGSARCVEELNRRGNKVYGHEVA